MFPVSIPKTVTWQVTEKKRLRFIRKMKIVANSSADVSELHNTPFAAVPLKVITKKKVF